ncbi:MAG: hypothetical protein OEQ53_16955 [Saprospiraceae bacterium]|nr:hypothetical protein [Saprospiraceae bacterium]
MNNQLVQYSRRQLASISLTCDQLGNQSNLVIQDELRDVSVCAAYINCPWLMSGEESDPVHDWTSHPFFKYYGNTTVSYPASGLGTLLLCWTPLGVKQSMGIFDHVGRYIGINRKSVYGISRSYEWHKKNYGVLDVSCQNPQRSSSLPRPDDLGYVSLQNIQKEQINWVTTSELVSNGSEVSAVR